GYALIGVYAAELVLIMLYQQHVGLGPLPAAEPFGSLTIVAVALAVLTLRNQRERIGLAFIRTVSETTALVRLAPLVASIRDAIEPTIRALDTIKPSSDPQVSALSRSISRLSSLREQLRTLSTPALMPRRAEEESLLAKESQEGAIITGLAGI